MGQYPGFIEVFEFAKLDYVVISYYELTVSYNASYSRYAIVILVFILVLSDLAIQILCQETPQL
jgi:hypothetical protein